jgi:hypothetical protein
MTAAGALNQEKRNEAALTPEDDPARVLCRWRSHPVRAGGRRLKIAVSALVIVPAGLYLMYGPFFGLLALAILGFSLFPYFLPTDYVLYAGGLESVFLGIHRRFTWEQFRSYYPDKHGVLLSPFARPSRLENFRGIYLRFGDRPGDVMAVVSEKISAPSQSAEPSEGRDA